MARAIWSGSINFGLVTIPIKLWFAVREHELRFHFLHAKDEGRINNVRVCSAARVVIKTREHLAAVKPNGRSLVLELMHFPDEIAQVGEHHFPSAKTKAGQRRKAAEAGKRVNLMDVLQRSLPETRIRRATAAPVGRGGRRTRTA